MGELTLPACRREQLLQGNPLLTQSFIKPNARHRLSQRFTGAAKSSQVWAMVQVKFRPLQPARAQLARAVAEKSQGRVVSCAVTNQRGSV